MIIVSALSERKRVKKERELDNKRSIGLKTERFNAFACRYFIFF